MHQGIEMVFCRAVTILIALLIALLVAVPAAADDELPPPPVQIPSPLQEQQNLRLEDRWIAQPEFVPQFDDPFLLVEPQARLSPLQTFVFYRRIHSGTEQLREMSRRLHDLYGNSPRLRPELTQAFEDAIERYDTVIEVQEAMLELSSQILVENDLFVPEFLETQADEQARKSVELHGELRQLHDEMAMFQFAARQFDAAAQHFDMARFHRDWSDTLRSF